MLKNIFFILLMIGIVLSSCRTKSVQPSDVAHNDIEITTKYIEGFRQAFLQQYDAAQNIFTSILEKNPYHHPSHYELGKLFFNEGKYDEAIQHLNKAAKLDPENIWYKILLAQSYVMIGDYSKAIEVYQKLTRQYPNSSDFWMKLGDLYFQANNPNKALETYNFLEKRIGPSEDIYRKKFEIYFATGQEEKAYQELANMLKIIPDNPQYALKLAEYYFRTGRFQLGYDYIQKTLSYDPSNTLANLYLADYYFIIKDTMKAKEQVNSLIERADISIDDKVFIILSLMQKKDLYGDSMIIFSFIDTLIKQYPDEAKIYALSGDIHFQRKNYVKAIEFWKRSIHLDSSRYLVWENLLYAQFITDDRSGLFTYVPRAMELFPEQAHLQFFHYFMEFIKQNFEGAGSQLKSYIKFFKDKELERFTKTLIMLSNLYLTSESEEALVNDLENIQVETFSYIYFCYLIQIKTDTLKALNWANDHPFIYTPHKTYLNAIKSYHEKNYSHALSYLKNADYPKEYFPETLELAGDAALKIGFSEQAIDWWTQAFTLTRSSRISSKIQTQLNHEKK